MVPNSITKYLASRTARDVDAAMRWYADDVEVTDEGATRSGRGWRARPASTRTRPH